MIYRVGQDRIYTVYIRYFWQGNHQIYGHIRYIYRILANPSDLPCRPVPQGQCDALRPCTQGQCNELTIVHQTQGQCDAPVCLRVNVMHSGLAAASVILHTSFPILTQQCFGHARLPVE